MADQPDAAVQPTGIGVTSLGVALLRARESRRGDRLFHDPYAQDFVDHADLDQPLLRAAASEPDFFELMAEQVAVRTRFFDQALPESAHGQVVLLACGMDARAFRLDWPAGVTVYELDQPDVLTFKGTVLARRHAQPRCHRVPVPVDLRTDWPRTLTEAGFHPGEPTAWLAEGILYALPPQAADTFLDQITSLSAPGSTLALDHGQDSEPLRAARAAISPELVDLWQGGPTHDLHAWLRQRGWTAEVHDIADVAATYRRPAPLAFDPDDDHAGRGWLATATKTAC